MNERIMGTGKMSLLHPNTVVEQRVELFNIYSADMHHVIGTVPGIEAAKKFLEQQVLLENQCPSCED